MNYQKIILLGEVVNEPKNMKTEEGVFSQVKFDLAVKHFSDEAVVFPVVVTYAVEEMKQQETFKGQEVLVEGVVLVDQKGGFFVQADWIENGYLATPSVDRSKLLF